MNLKTTFVLILLAGAGTGGWFWLEFRKSTVETVSPSVKFLQTKIAADKITRVEVTRMAKPPTLAPVYACVLGALGAAHGPEVASTAFPEPVLTTFFILEKSGDEWSLPGNWRVRALETEEWIAELAALRTRFAPIPLSKDSDLKPYGLHENPLVIKTSVGDESHTLRFGEESASENTYTRSTFVRLDEEPEVLRLGPGVFAALARKADYFRQLRLFPIDRAAKQSDSKKKFDTIASDLIEVESKDGKFIIVKKDQEWVLREAHKKDDKKWKQVASEDRLDPARRDAILRGFPELWAGQFVENRSLEECGLKEPEFILTASKPGGGRIRVLIGDVSKSETRLDSKAGPPGMPPRRIKDEYRYAKLEKNDQIFEMKADKLADITVPLDELRDPLLARFKPDDVKRLEIGHGDQELVLVKVKDNDKEKWRFEKPSKDDADAKTVEDLLEKLASLEARGKDIHDETDLKTVGIEKPQGRIKITLEEVDKDAKKKTEGKDAVKKSREIVFQLGQKEKEIDKLYVRVDGWPRVNEVNGDLWKWVSGSDLAFRPRELWKLDRASITRITIQADAAPYHLSRAEKLWKISGPIEADAVATAVEPLADELANLKAERFEVNPTKDLARFGLDKPAFKIDVTAPDGKQRTLQIGKSIESKDGGSYAKLGDGDAVFVLSEKLTGQLRKDPLDLIEKNLLTLNPAAIERIRFQNVAASFTLASKKDRWQVLDSPAPAFSVDDEMIKGFLGAWRLLRADKIVAVGPKIDLPRFGLDKPAATITVSLKATDKDKASEHVIELGKDAEGGGRYARVDKKDVVAVFDAFAIEDLQPVYLDFVDPRVLRFFADGVTAIERKMKDADLELTRREDNWLITKPGGRDADVLTINDILKKTSGLRARRIAAYPAKDLQTYGLDKPTAVVTLLLETDGNTSRHVIKIGKLAKDKTKQDTDERFAMIDDRPMVVVLPADLSRHLVAPPLYFADRNLANFGSIDRVELTRGLRKAAFTRLKIGWKMTEPIELFAEDPVIDDLIASMQRLRADEIVADKGADLKKYGLDQPVLQWRFKSGDTEQLHLIVGALENDLPGARRYAKLGDKQQVFLLSARVTAKVQSEARDRRPWQQFVTPSKMSFTQGGTTFTLIQKGLDWQVGGDPAKKVDAKIVADAIDAFEKLRASRYVIDTKADLKPYGLAEPTWKIVLDVAKDTRVLWLGGFEEKSKRYYATVPGSGAVFVLDESISARITRNLEAYLEMEKQK